MTTNKMPRSLRYLSEIETAEIMGQSPGALRKNRHLRKGLPYIKVGGLIRYKLEDIERFMDANRISFDV